MKKSIYVKIRNALHPYYGECYRCGGNWGWKKEVIHDTNPNGNRGLFLFCKECDKVVTLEERWEALDQWKDDCIRLESEQIHIIRLTEGEELPDIFKDIRDREFVEFPRG